LETRKTLKILEKTKKECRKTILEHEVKGLCKVLRNLPPKFANVIISILLNTPKMLEKTFSAKKLNLNFITIYGGRNEPKIHYC